MVFLDMRSQQTSNVLDFRPHSSQERHIDRLRKKLRQPLS